jgi:hypothetical protein
LRRRRTFVTDFRPSWFRDGRLRSGSWLRKRSFSKNRPSQIISVRAVGWVGLWSARRKPEILGGLHLRIEAVKVTTDQGPSFEESHWSSTALIILMRVGKCSRQHHAQLLMIITRPLRIRRG